MASPSSYAGVAARNRNKSKSKSKSSNDNSNDNSNSNSNSNEKNNENENNNEDFNNDNIASPTATATKTSNSNSNSNAPTPKNGRNDKGKDLSVIGSNNNKKSGENELTISVQAAAPISSGKIMNGSNNNNDIDNDNHNSNDVNVNSTNNGNHNGNDNGNASKTTHTPIPIPIANTNANAAPITDSEREFPSLDHHRQQIRQHKPRNKKNRYSNYTYNNNSTSNNSCLTQQHQAMDDNFITQQIAELSRPPPTSFTLIATLQLLIPLNDSKHDAFLMTRSYLQNWLIWAYHQKVPKGEAARVDEAVRLAATKFGLAVPVRDLQYQDPGPVDLSILGVPQQPLLLRPDVQLFHDYYQNDNHDKHKENNNNKNNNHQSNKNQSISSPAQNNKDQAQQLINASTTTTNQQANSEQQQAQQQQPPVPEEIPQIDQIDGNLICCAVSDTFYETIRSVHGVICSDGLTVSFQPVDQTSQQVILYHRSPKATTTSMSITSPQIDNNSNNNNIAKNIEPRPVEFRRKILLKPAPTNSSKQRSSASKASSPMTKLLDEEQKRAKPTMIAQVEIHPLKISYKYDNSTDVDDTGFVLVSQVSSAHDTLNELMKITAPTSPSTCVRVWSYRDKGTTSGDGYELIDLDSLDGKLLKKDGTQQITKLKTIGQWAQSHGNHQKDTNNIHVLVETRRPGAEWLRNDLVLSNRLQVGDFVDAQDSTGKWYEAIVRRLTEKTVVVHYLGWASRWDATIRRYPKGDVDGIVQRVRAPAPLWSQTTRWREKLTKGKVLEVRDSSSVVERPKWYKGVVKWVDTKETKVREVTGGAQVEMHDIPQQNGGTKKSPLLLLGKTKQILVKVAQERSNNGTISGQNPDNSVNDDDDDDDDDYYYYYNNINNIDEDLLEEPKADPPYLRWVNLYGEEVCEAGTHMKLDTGKNAAVVTLRYEYDAGRKPVEILKPFNNMFGAGIVKESLRGTPPAPGSVGLHNLGNSCFLNSIVQCLNHIEQLTQYFLKGNYQHDLNRKNPLGSGGIVAMAYAALLREMWNGKYSALAPRKLKQTVASFAPQFNNSYQHDSQEFCQFLMDGLHEDLNRVQEKPYVEELEGFGMEDKRAAIETWRKHLLRHDSIIVDHFQGMHRSHLTCPVCGRESIKFDVFSSISLPLVVQTKEKVTIRLEDCIEKFMEGEQLDEFNAWYCPSCKKHVCALKMIALWSVPDILIIHLKRFHFAQCGMSNQVVRSKVDNEVKFPVEGLDLSKYVLGPKNQDSPPVYKLFGVSEHCGPTANSGHYTATVRNSKDGRWYRYNDAHVGPTTGDAAVTGGAYVLFYRRSKGIAKWGGMEQIMTELNIDPYAGDVDADGFTVVKPKKSPTKKPNT